MPITSTTPPSVNTPIEYSFQNTSAGSNATAGQSVVSISPITTPPARNEHNTRTMSTTSADNKYMNNMDVLDSAVDLGADLPKSGGGEDEIGICSVAKELDGFKLSPTDSFDSLNLDETMGKNRQTRKPQKPIPRASITQASNDMRTSGQDEVSARSAVRKIDMEVRSVINAFYALHDPTQIKDILSGSFNGDIIKDPDRSISIISSNKHSERNGIGNKIFLKAMSELKKKGNYNNISDKEDREDFQRRVCAAFLSKAKNKMQFVKITHNQDIPMSQKEALKRIRLALNRDYI